MEHARGTSTLTDAFDHYCSVFRVQYIFQNENEEKKMQLIVKDDIQK
jgi:hypothetical protein